MIKPNPINLGTHVSMPGLFHHLDELRKWRDYEKVAPLYVEISPTSRCNHKCFFCYVDNLNRPNYEIPGDRLIKLFKEMAEAGVKSCEVQGTGEPFMNDALPEAILKGKSAGMDICVVTNGTLLSKDVINKILPSISFLRISSLEADLKLYSRTHGCPESHYTLSMNAIKEAVSVKQRKRLDTVIVCTFTAFDYNVHGMKKTAEILRDIGIDIFTIKPALNINPNHHWKQGLHRRFVHEFQDVCSMSTKDFKVNVRDDFFEFYEFPEQVQRSYETCYGCELEIHIDANCRAYPCISHWGNERYCFGDLSSQSFDRFWYSDNRKKQMNKFFTEVNAKKCTVRCKQHGINSYLSAMRHPPLHVNVI